MGNDRHAGHEAAKIGVKERRRRCAHKTAPDEVVIFGNFPVDVNLVGQWMMEESNERRAFEENGDVIRKKLGRRAGVEPQDLARTDVIGDAPDGQGGVPLDQAEDKILSMQLQETARAHHGSGDRGRLDGHFLAVLRFGKEDCSGLKIDFVVGDGIIENGVGSQTCDALVGQFKLGAGFNTGLEVLAVLDDRARLGGRGDGGLDRTVLDIINGFSDFGCRVRHQGADCRNENGE